MTPRATGLPAWDDLVTAAVLGTERRPFTGVSLAGPAGGLIDRVSRTAGLAGAVAVVWAYQQAGQAAVPAPALPVGPVPAPADGRPLLGAGPVRTLRAILEDPALRPVLPEWLHLAARSARRLPAEWLPAVFEAVGSAAHGVLGGSERADLDRLAGPRGRWLAAVHPLGSAILPPGRGGAGDRLARAVLSGGESAWDAEGDVSDGDRLLAFVSVRSADPDLGRRLAEHIWPGEPGATRAPMISAFGAGLSMADEPFLESCLDDRRRDVRSSAAALLRRLPDSRLAGRMAARAVPLVRLPGRSANGLDVELPPPADRAARRDGLGPVGTTNGAAGGDRAGDLVAMVAAAPLAVWECRLRRPPAELTALAARSGERGEWLIEGWADAAAAAPDPVWARAVLDAGARPVPALLRQVAPDVAEQALTAWLGRTPLPAALVVLADLPVPWSGPVSDAVLDGLAQLVSSGATAGAGPARDALRMVSLAVHPDRAPATAALSQLEAQVPAGPRAAARLFWGRALSTTAATVHFRQAMYQEFR